MDVQDDRKDRLAEAGSDAHAEQGPGEQWELVGAVKVSLVGLFLLACVAALYAAGSVLLPILLAFLLALVLSPVVRFLSRRGIPAPATAAALVTAILVVVVAGVYSLSGPVAKWVDSAPRIGAQIQYRLEALRGTMAAVQQASEQIDDLATARKGRDAAQEVVIKEPSLVGRTAAGLPEAIASTGLTLVLLLFLLASGDLIYEKIIRVLPTFRDKKLALRIAFDVEREVSRYLATVFAINLGLGVCVGTAMWLLGMPNPTLWGAIAFAFNFVPYIGGVVGMMLVAAVSLVTFTDLWSVLLPPVVYILCTSIEGQIITPTILGRRLKMNTVAVFLAVAVWAWLWGIAGAIIAVPMLVVLKVFAQHVDALSGVGEFLSERTVVAASDDPPPATPPRGDSGPA
jgi:predicted PurR-regulated permease PerM